MAIHTVTTTDNTVDPADGQLSLREALALADADPATPDTIDFAPSVQGGRIVLAGSQLTINSDVMIDGGAGVTLDAGQRSRVLLVQDGTQADTNQVSLANLTITCGHTSGDGENGGGVLAGGYTTLTLTESTVSGNRTMGYGARGGGIAAYSTLTLTRSLVAGNSTTGDGAYGGGILAQDYLTLINSTVIGNSTAGTRAMGGGIYGRFVTATNTTVSGNSTTGDYAQGGGICMDYSQPSPLDLTVLR